LQRTQRRLAAVFAADVVGYSRLMELDEAGTLARLKTTRETLIEPKISEHDGRVVKLMGGEVSNGRTIRFASTHNSSTP
jgi:adenylate cyclase